MDLLAEDVAVEAGVASLVFAGALLAAAIYEAFAIKTDRLPTITELVKSGGWPARIGFVTVVGAALLDHFVFGLVL